MHDDPEHEDPDDPCESDDPDDPCESDESDEPDGWHLGILFRLHLHRRTFTLFVCEVPCVCAWEPPNMELIPPNNELTWPAASASGSGSPSVLAID